MAPTVFSRRAPADPSSSGHFSKKNRVSAKEFLAVADDLVDQIEGARLHGHVDPQTDVLEYLKQRHSRPAALPSSQTLPARFKREPDIFLGNLRFGRTRLFLSRFIGDLAWYGVSL